MDVRVLGRTTLLTHNPPDLPTNRHARHAMFCRAMSGDNIESRIEDSAFLARAMSPRSRHGGTVAPRTLATMK